MIIGFYGSLECFICWGNGVVIAMELKVGANYGLSVTQLVIQAFQNYKLIPWHIRYKRINCMEKSIHFNLYFTHIYRECN